MIKTGSYSLRFIFRVYLAVVNKCLPNFMAAGSCLSNTHSATHLAYHNQGKSIEKYNFQ